MQEIFDGFIFFGTEFASFGHGCESCTFTKKESGEVTGCWCKRAASTPGCQTESRYDHLVSTSSNVIED